MDVQNKDSLGITSDIHSRQVHLNQMDTNHLEVPKLVKIILIGLLNLPSLTIFLNHPVRKITISLISTAKNLEYLFLAWIILMMLALIAHGT